MAGLLGGLEGFPEGQSSTAFCGAGCHAPRRFTHGEIFVVLVTQTQGRIIMVQDVCAQKMNTHLQPVVITDCARPVFPGQDQPEHQTHGEKSRGKDRDYEGPDFHATERVQPVVNAINLEMPRMKLCGWFSPKKDQPGYQHVEIADTDLTSTCSHDVWSATRAHTGASLLSTWMSLTCGWSASRAAESQLFYTMITATTGR